MTRLVIECRSRLDTAGDLHLSQKFEPLMARQIQGGVMMKSVIVAGLLLGAVSCVDGGGGRKRVR